MIPTPGPGGETRDLAVTLRAATARACRFPSREGSTAVETVRRVRARGVRASKDTARPRSQVLKSVGGTWRFGLVRCLRGPRDQVWAHRKESEL